VLFVKERMAWPRSSGHDVHTFHMMQALAARGHAVALASMAPIPPEATAGGGLEAEFSIAENTPPVPEPSAFPLRLTKLQEKFRDYWGVEADRVRWVAAAAAEFRADAVVVSGLNVLPYLGALPPETVTAWYAADEWVWHHLSQVRPLGRSTWGELKPALVKGIYERAYRSRLDRVWAVSTADARAFRWLAGIRHVDVISNGVDAEHYRPGDEPRRPNSCVFWGRLDFGPNVQALEWFVRRVWPRVRRAVPDARFQVYGFQPTAAVRALVGRDGIELTADLPDIRPAVRGHMVAVLPFVSGGGIKNKLLEAAAMGLPTLATPRVLAGLNGTPPLPALRTPAAWAAKLVELWRHPAERERLGAAARAWVIESHTWAAAAAAAEAGLLDARERKRAAGRHSLTPLPVGERGGG
jgi:glycosyltransferase involved in cell wall biosynthesis